MRAPRAALLLAVVVLALPSPAGAHAAYRASDPADEERVASPPASVWAEFTEPVTLDSRLEVYDSCGVRVDGGDSQVTGYRITVSMDGEHAGTHTVTFAVVSAVDGHLTQGSFTFDVTSGEPCPDAGSLGSGDKTQDRESEPAETGALGEPGPALAQTAQPAATPEPGRADPPLGGVLAGLAVAAAIGVVGGFIYVRLLRPPP